VYEIIGALGAGGMGEVYRARDTELGRDVAIKVLPRMFLADPERLARFEREARILATLNHPNIAAIYGLEVFDGVRALVLELVEGQTLAERIGGRKIGDWRSALIIARQIADALEAAHDKGIVHRDLKPANIKITPADVVKVLDFGLAKTDPAPGFGVSDVSKSPTLSVGGTRQGALLGTAAYMSPEQARGQTVDKRADIWAFGCVLYELLTGRLAFSGNTVSDHIAAILEREPDWTVLPPTTPSSVQGLLRRCLEKDAKRRLHDIADARIEIDDALSERHAAPERAGRPTRLMQAIAAVSLVAAGTVAGWTVSNVTAPRQPPGADRPLTRFVIEPPASARYDGSFDISQDGSQLAYSGAVRVHLRRLDQFDATPLMGTEGAGLPFFSPDGEWLAFVSGVRSNRLSKISLKGAATPITLSEFDDGIIGASWPTDDTILVATVEHGLQRVSAQGGNASILTTLGKEPPEIDHHSPVLLPGGRAVMFTIHQGIEQFAIAVQSLDSGQRTVVIESGYDARYLPSGHIVYASGSAILAVPFDLRRLRVSASPVTLVENVATVPSGGEGIFRISKTGALVYQPKQSTGNRTLVWVNRAGVEEPLRIAPQAFANPRISFDGKQLAFVATNDDRSDIWAYEFATERRWKVTNEGQNQTPVWTRDGRWLTYTTIRAGTQQIVRQPIDASGSPEVLIARRMRLFPNAWLPDGRGLFYMESLPALPDLTDIRFLSVDGERPSVAVVQRSPTARERAPAVSPDGRWLAYAEFDKRHSEIFLQPIGASGTRRQISVDGGREPIWSHDGRELFFRSGRRIIAVPIDATHGLTAGKPVTLFERDYLSDGSAVFDYDVAPDGRFLMIRPSVEEQAPLRLNVVLNWGDELARRVPPVK
jgi:serine/threonine-protein kinase